MHWYNGITKNKSNQFMKMTKTTNIYADFIKWKEEEDEEKLKKE